MSSHFIRGLVFFLTTLLLSTTTSFALDYYVDGANGDNDNSGLSADDAWKTITYALEQATATEEDPANINIAAGTYAASTNGETFPLIMIGHVRLLGPGPDACILDAEYNANHIMICQSVVDVQVRCISLLHSYALGDAYSEDGGCPIICDRSSLELEDCLIAENSAMRREDAGAILCTDSRLSLDSCVIRDNLAGIRGGPSGIISSCGVRCEHSIFAARSCSIHGNKELPVGGFFSDVLSFTTCELSLFDCRVFDNTSGRIVLITLSSADVASCEISGNSGGVFAYGSQLTIQSCFLEDNVGDATLNCQPDCEAEITDCVIRGNTRGNGAYGESCVLCCNSRMHIRRCVIAENSAHDGAIEYVFENDSYYSSALPEIEPNGLADDSAQSFGLSIEDCLIYGNQSCYGGPIMNYRSQGMLPIARANRIYMETEEDYMVSVERCTIVGNRAFEAHADSLYIFPYVSSALFEDNIIADNDGGMPPEANDNVVRNCCLQEEYDGEGNFVADPLFASGPLGDYYLSCVGAGQQADSPCIDAGSTSAVEAGLASMTTRTDGEFDTGTLDIGYHYSATPPTIGCQVSDGTDALDAQPLLSGDPLVASFSVENAGLPLWVDIYAGFILPDGTILLVTPNCFSTEFAPLFETIHLPAGYTSDDIKVFDALIPDGLPDGTYTFAAALSLTGSFRPIGDIAACQFAVAN
ncbi:MAG: DUF1565 domain-containing protein [Candidatus Coatesbacteria bacterium]|nr:DUF1565 domain-containing protein [Candidatus Coatesbacteria bacterium]